MSITTSPHRANIINVLNLIASRNDQLEYQRSATLNVANELVSQWFGDFYHSSHVEFISEFSTGELARLSQFNAYYEERLTALPDSLEGLHHTRVWQEVMAFAGKVLDACNWRGMEARYG